MQIVIDIPDAPMKDYQDLYWKIHGMAASEGLFDDKEKSQRALALKAVLDILGGIVDGTPLPKGHGRLIDADEIEHYMLPSEKQDKKTWFVHSEEYRNAVLHFNNAIRLLRDNAPTIIEADKAESEE